MDDTLGVGISTLSYGIWLWVLILIVMDDTLGELIL